MLRCGNPAPVAPHRPDAPLRLLRTAPVPPHRPDAPLRFLRTAPMLRCGNPVPVPPHRPDAPLRHSCPGCSAPPRCSAPAFLSLPPATRTELSVANRGVHPRLQSSGRAHTRFYRGRSESAESVPCTIRKQIGWPSDHPIASQGSLALSPAAGELGGRNTEGERSGVHLRAER